MKTVRARYPRTVFETLIREFSNTWTLITAADPENRVRLRYKLMGNNMPCFGVRDPRQQTQAGTASQDPASDAFYLGDKKGIRS
jgi:hypothetical protein